MSDHYQLKTERYEQAATHKLLRFSWKTYVFGYQDSWKGGFKGRKCWNDRL